MNQADLQTILAQGESMTVEFKSDRGPLDDAELLNTVVCLANAQGGLLLIGVEDDGTVSGLHSSHRTRPEILAAFVASRTVPPLNVEASFETLPGREQIALLRVPDSAQPVATSDGRLSIRYLDTHGKPGCRPLYPHELTGWRADRGLADMSALVVPGAEWEDLDPLEFARLRRLIQENRGDAILLELSDREVARALGLVRAEDGTLYPTLAGVLLVGKEDALRQYIPAHEVAFQVLHGTDVATNEFRRWPLLHIHEWLLEAIGVRNEEQELMIGAFRVGVPRYDRRGIREAVNNALIHRDYGQLGAVHVQLYDGYALVANPGGFVANVRPDNLLVTAPRPRNPLLADVFKRVGLVERTGRGVSIIYAGQLRNGRRPPSYARSTPSSVTVTLDSSPSDLRFVTRTIQANKDLGRTLTVPELLVLWELSTVGQATLSEIADLTQQELREARALVQQMIEHQLVTDLDGERGAVGLGPAFQSTQGHVEVGPSVTGRAIESEVMAHVRQHGRIRRGQVEEMGGLSRDQAYRLLRRLVQQGKLEAVGRGRSAHYQLVSDSP